MGRLAEGCCEEERIRCKREAQQEVDDKNESRAGFDKDLLRPEDGNNDPRREIGETQAQMPRSIVEELKNHEKMKGKGTYRIRAESKRPIAVI